MDSIIIGKPYITTNLGKARLVSDIAIHDIIKQLYYEVDEKYMEYLCDERADTFLIGLIYFAMVNGYNIKCEHVVSERLFYQIVNYYIPTLSNCDPGLFHNINIECPLTSEPIKNAGAVGTGCSGGVDSFYTILKHLKNDSSSYNLTHLLICNFFSSYHGEKDVRQRFSGLSDMIQPIADDLKLPLIRIYSNLYEFYHYKYKDLHSLKYISFVYALQKLFSVYYFSNTYSNKLFSFTNYSKSSAYYDIFTVHYVSTDNLTVYSTGGEVSRAIKIDFIADNPVVQRYLNVCNHYNANCSECKKCLETAAVLMALNKHKAYSNVFDLIKVKRSYNRTMIRIIGSQSDLAIDVISLIKKKGLNVPFYIKLVGWTARVLYFPLIKLRKIERVYRIYAKFRMKGNDNDERMYSLDYDYAKSCNSSIIR